MSSSNMAEVAVAGAVHFALLVAQFCVAMAQTNDGGAAPPPALFMFGASTVDPGNNNALPTQMRCDFPPYGSDFLGTRPTGRFSNGKIPSDLIASRLGVKEYVPPYVGVQLRLEDFLTGVSFASGGTGYDPLTSQMAAVLSMQQQLNLFKEYKQRLRLAAGEDRATAIVTGAVYTINAGTDDIANTYFGASVRRTQYQLPSYVEMITNLTAAFLEGLFKEGARKIAIMSLPPVGCLPSQRTLGGGVWRMCSAASNDAARTYNSRVALLLPELREKLPGTTFQFLDIYAIMSDMIQRPSEFGFEEVTRGCCGTGAIETAVTCNRLTPVTCADHRRFMFWDSYHLTERAYEIIMNHTIDQYNLF